MLLQSGLLQRRVSRVPGFDVIIDSEVPAAGGFPYFMISLSFPHKFATSLSQQLLQLFGVADHFSDCVLSAGEFERSVENRAHGNGCASTGIDRWDLAILDNRLRSRNLVDRPSVQLDKLRHGFGNAAQ